MYTMEHLMNKTASEINEFYNLGMLVDDDIRQMIRYYFSRHLMDTSESNVMDVSIPFTPNDTFGVSTNDMLRITYMYQDPSEGYIVFVIEYETEIDFDDIDTNTLINIMNEFDEKYNS